MIAEAFPQVYEQTRPGEADLLACLRKIGKRAAIGSLQDIEKNVAGEAGTIVCP